MIYKHIRVIISCVIKIPPVDYEKMHMSKILIKYIELIGISVKLILVIDSADLQNIAKTFLLLQQSINK